MADLVQNLMVSYKIEDLSYLNHRTYLNTSFKKAYNISRKLDMSAINLYFFIHPQQKT